MARLAKCENCGGRLGSRQFAAPRTSVGLIIAASLAGTVVVGGLIAAALLSGSVGAALPKPTRPYTITDCNVLAAPDRDGALKWAKEQGKAPWVFLPQTLFGEECVPDWKSVDALFYNFKDNEVDALFLFLLIRSALQGQVERYPDKADQANKQVEVIRALGEKYGILVQGWPKGLS